MMEWKITESSILGEKVYHALPEPGPALYILPHKGYSKKYAIFSTRFGSIDNCFRGPDGEEVRVPDGVAHFLEHKLFEDEEGNVFDRFAAYGASSNAFTSFTHTTYLFSCTDYFRENFKLLLEFVQNPYFTEESVAKEQGIIQQEIRMYQDNPDWRVFSNLLRALYREHPVKNDIAGSIESIQEITKDLLYKCYHTFYHPANMALFVTGDLSPEAVLEQVLEVFQGRRFTPPPSLERCYPREPRDPARKKITQELAVSQPILNLGFKDPYDYLEGEELLSRELATELLLEMIFGKSEELFNQLYAEGLIDEHFSAGFVAECTYGYTLLGGKTKDPEQLHEKLLKGIEKARKEGLKEESFQRHKRKMQGEFIKSFNSLEFVANNYLAYNFKGIEFFRFLDALEKITIEDLEERLHEHLREELQAVSVVYPYQK